MLKFKFTKTRKIFIFLIFLSEFACSQNTSATWCFGDSVCLKFLNGLPILLPNSSMTQFEGCSSISNHLGDLIYYTNGVDVWNRKHQKMPNGFGLMGNVSSCQSVLSVKQPGNDSIYYLFTTDNDNGNNGLKYSTINIFLDSGYGDIVSKNIMLEPKTCEKLSACLHSNGIDKWIVTQSFPSMKLHTYLLTSSGLNTNPIISNIAGMPNSNLGYVAAGGLKFNLGGNMLAMAMHNPGQFWLLNFNKSSGTFQSIGEIQGYDDFGAYNVEFSPSGQFLYATNQHEFEIYQWDVSSSNLTTIQTSKQTFPTQYLGASYSCGLQLAPDGKIYYARSDCKWLGVIQNPDSAGTKCAFINKGFFCGTSKPVLEGLPNYDVSEISFVKINNYCFGDTTLFTVFDSANYISLSWDFGDPGSGTFNLATTPVASHYYSLVGKYFAKLIREKNIAPMFDTVLYEINISYKPMGFLGVDTLLCNGQSINLATSSLYNNYSWSNGSNNPIINVNTSGSYMLTVNQSGCVGNDTINISFQNCILPIINFSSSDSTFCDKNCIDFFDLSLNNPSIWSWNFTGATPSVSTLQNPSGICYNSYGNFDVQLIACNSFGCDTLLMSNFINEYQLPATPQLSVSNDTIYCNTPNVNYAWFNVNNTNQILATTNYFVPNINGNYYVIITDSLQCSVPSTVVPISIGLEDLFLINNLCFYQQSENAIIFENITSKDQYFFELFDAKGKIIITSTVSQDKTQVKMGSKLTIGIYTVRIFNQHENKVYKIWLF